MVQFVPTRLDRVRANSPKGINREIDKAIERNVQHFTGKSKKEISDRIEDLQKEWDIERVLELNAAVIAFVGTALGALLNSWFLLIPAIVTAFLFQHAVQGWCPPMPLFRRMGKRTRKKIDAETFAMKALRGDLDGLDHRKNKDALAEAVISKTKM